MRDLVRKLIRGPVSERQLMLDSLLPKKSRHDDIFLVSFPKSGNTWISFIIANIIIEKLKIDIEANFFNIHFFVPDIYLSRDIKEDLEYFPCRRIIKSHSWLHPKYLNIIYIVRDPRSVMVSYYRYLKGLGQYSKDLTHFVHDSKKGIKAWQEHVEGWIDGVAPYMRLHVFKYEDFKEKSDETVIRLAGLLGFHLEPEELSNILEKTSFEFMQSLEKKTTGIRAKEVNRKFKFIRKGEIASWKNELGTPEIEFVNTHACDMMQRLNYL